MFLHFSFFFFAFCIYLHLYMYIYIYVHVFWITQSEQLASNHLVTVTRIENQEGISFFFIYICVNVWCVDPEMFWRELFYLLSCRWWIRNNFNFIYCHSSEFITSLCSARQKFSHSEEFLTLMNFRNRNFLMERNKFI